MQYARQRVRELTARERLRLPVGVVVQDLNRFLRGWVGYFRYGNSTRDFDKIKVHALSRVSLFVGQTAPAAARVGLVALRLSDAEPPRPDRPQLKRHRPAPDLG